MPDTCRSMEELWPLVSPRAAVQQHARKFMHHRSRYADHRLVGPIYEMPALVSFSVKPLSPTRRNTVATLRRSSRDSSQRQANNEKPIKTIAVKTIFVARPLGQQPRASTARASAQFAASCFTERPEFAVEPRRHDEQRHRIEPDPQGPRRRGTHDAPLLHEQPQHQEIDRKLRKVELGGQVGPSGALDECERNIGDAVHQHARRQPLQDSRAR